MRTLMMPCQDIHYRRFMNVQTGFEFGYWTLEAELIANCDEFDASS